MGKELRQNKDLAAYNAELQTKENVRQEQWTADEWSRQFGLQEKQWQQHFQTEADWNSEQSKAQRLREVGVNPVSVLGGSQSAPVAHSSQGTPSVTPRSGVSSSPAPFSASTPQILNSLNEFVKTYSSARLNESEKTKIDSMLAGELKMQFAELQSERERAIGLQLANWFEQTNMPVRLQKEMVGVYNQMSETVRNYSQAKDFDASAARTQILSMLDKQMYEFKEKMNPLEWLQLKSYVDFMPDIMMSQIQYNRSAAQKNAAEASHAVQLAKSVEFMNDINIQTKDGLLSKFWDSVQQAYNESQISGYQRDVANYTSQIMRYTNDQKVLNFWKDFALDIIKGGTDIVNAVANVKSMGAWKSMSETQKKRVDAEVKEIEKRYGSRYELDREFKNGKWQTTRARMSTSSKEQFDSSLNR